MPKLIDEELRKIQKTFRISKYVLDELVKINNYNQFLEDIIIEKLGIERRNMPKK